MSDKLPRKELESRDESISQLQETLERKLQISAEATRRYQTLVDEETTLMEKIKMVKNWLSILKFFHKFYLSSSMIL